MLELQYEKSFKKDFKRMLKRGCNQKHLKDVLSLLVEQKPLPEKYKDHNLSGNYKGCRECHIEPDWLLIYKVYNDKLVLVLTRTGSHSDLF